MIVWYLQSWDAPKNKVSAAWMVAGSFIPISFGWAAGDVSLAAYIQALLQRQEAKHNDVSPLGAVMAFLYSTYIVTYAISSPLLGKYIDNVSSKNKGDIHDAIFNIAGVQFTVLAITILLATFIPQGAFSLNPRSLYGETLQHDESKDKLVSEDHVAMKYEAETGIPGN
jgi:MFS family permease